MQRLVVRQSSRKLLGLLAVSVAFVAAGVLMLLAESGTRRFPLPMVKLTGALCVAFFGAATVALARQAFASPERIVIDDEGIVDRMLGLGRIPWDAVSGAYLRTVEGQSFVCLQLRQPEAWLRKLPWTKRALAPMNERMGMTPFVLNFTAADSDAATALDAIQTHLALRAIS